MAPNSPRDEDDSDPSWLLNPYAPRDLPLIETPVPVPLELPRISQHAPLFYRQNRDFLRGKSLYFFQPLYGKRFRVFVFCAILFLIWFNVHRFIETLHPVFLIVLGVVALLSILFWKFRYTAPLARQQANATTDHILVGKILRVVRESPPSKEERTARFPDKITWVYQFITPEQHTITDTVTRHLYPDDQGGIPDGNDKAYICYYNGVAYWVL